MEESKVRKGREGPIRRRRKEGGESSFPFNNYGRKKEQITDLDISYEKINKCKKEENQKTKLKGGL